MALLNEIKQSPNIPTDILGRIEEAKEIAVRKFENKLDLIDDARVEAQFIDKFDDQNVEDLVTLEEFKSRMKVGTDALKSVEDAHARSIEAFKKTFTDADSGRQAEDFSRLSKEMLNNPTPKTFKLIAELETKERDEPPKKNKFNKK